MSTAEEQYKIVEKIGEGGMGTVFLANDTMLERQVAIKQLNRSSEEVDTNIGDRFQQEALALAKLNHPNITHLYAFLPKENTYWMVMEYVEGKTLEGWLHIHKKITYQLAASIAVQLLDGLSHAHKKGIIHRDIKPANVMINEDGEVKIMDFGIARMRNVQRITRHGKSVGTLEYMAPEQIQGHEGDERTDVYAVGNILYELLCGIPPYQADTDYQIMKDKLEKDPQPVLQFNPSVPIALQKIIFKALERKQEKRYASAQEFKQAIEKNLQGVLLSQHELTKVLIASQEFTTPSASNEPLSVTALLAKAKTISGNLKVPQIKKINKPAIILVASVILCIALLLWSSSSESSSDIAEPENEPTYVEAAPEIEQQTNVTSTTGSIEETPNEMYQRISNRGTASVNVTTPQTQPKENTSKKTVKKVAKEKEEDNDYYVDREKNSRTRSYNEPVDVPTGRSIRVTLSENISSEDVNRDGDALRFTCGENVEAGGRVIIKKGALVTGKIVDVIASTNGRKKALVGFVLQRVQAVDGSSIKIHSQRYRLFADAPGQSVSYRSGQSFTAELGRGRVR